MTDRFALSLGKGIAAKGARSMNGPENLCTCAEVRDHIVACRATADERTVAAWHSGALTLGSTRLGFMVKGLGRPRSSYSRSVRRRAIALVLDSIPLFDLIDIPALVHAAEKTFRYDYDTEDSRRLTAIRNADKQRRRRESVDRDPSEVTRDRS